MYTRQTTVCNKSGLHARPAADFVKEAVKYKSSIKISKRGRSGEAVNAKSMVLVLSLSAACGETIEVSAEGEDEQRAVDALIDVVDAATDEKE
ncbi:MAG: HPr family phosphocarrier protein [Oscillospiraceae bacterium]|nr:HPr family phosphocarrier protein [Oscillospiraceae bacterium]